MHLSIEHRPSVRHPLPAVSAAVTRAEVADGLVNIANKAVEKRFIRRGLSSRWLLSAHEETVRVARCSWAIGQTVGIRSDKGKACYESVETCSSVWACPACSAVIRQRRAAEIQQAVEAHQKEQKTLLFVTLTLPHRRADSLDATLDALLSGWREMTAQTAYKKVEPGVRSPAGIKGRYGITGVIRTTEVTYGENGWHPHLHLLFFLDREDMSKAEIRAFGDEIHTLWARIIQRRLGRKPTRTRGIDVQQVDAKGAVLARYLSKVQDGESEKTGSWSVGAEMARADIKKAKRGGLTPFQLLDDDACAHTGLSRKKRRELWLEFYASTHGRRCLSWSRGLKARFGIDEVDDSEVMDAEIQAVPMRWVAPTPAYRALSPVEKARVLALAELNEWGRVYELLPGVLLPGISTEPPPV